MLSGDLLNELLTVEDSDVEVAAETSNPQLGRSPGKYRPGNERTRNPS